MENQIIHVRHRRTKHSSYNQFYKSDKFDGQLGTLCGAPMTDRDIPFESCMNKHFDPSGHETIVKVEICRECLMGVMHP